MSSAVQHQQLTQQRLITHTIIFLINSPSQQSNYTACWPHVISGNGGGQQEHSNASLIGLFVRDAAWSKATEIVCGWVRGYAERQWDLN